MIDPDDVRLIRENAHREPPTPRGEAIGAALRAGHVPMSNELVLGRPFSPDARWHPDTSRALDEAGHGPTTVLSADLMERAGFVYEHSNLPDRKPRSYPGGRMQQEIPSDEVAAAADHRRSLELAEYGQVPVVILHDRRAPLTHPQLPQLGESVGAGDPTPIAFPVTLGWSVSRVAKVVMDSFATECWWHGKRTKVGHPASHTRNCGRTPEFGMLVSMRGATHVWPTCGVCRDEFAMDTERDGWKMGRCCAGTFDYVANDGWLQSEGYPADRWS